MVTVVALAFSLYVLQGCRSTATRIAWRRKPLRQQPLAVWADLQHVYHALPLAIRLGKVQLYDSRVQQLSRFLETIIPHLRNFIDFV